MNLKKLGKNNSKPKVNINNIKSVNISKINNNKNKKENFNNAVIIKDHQNSKNVNNKKSKDGYSQNFDMALMKKCPPNLPEIINYEQNFQNGENKIPRLNIFFGHLMTKKKRYKNYIKTSLTQRTKQKLIVYVYYKPLKF